MDASSSSATWRRKRIPRAKALRRDGTEAERRLWMRLRKRGLGSHKFRRQHSVCGYVVDFVCLEECLIVEVDGGQHAAQAAQDALRTVVLERQGFRVLRFWNSDVFENIEGVLATIAQALQQRAVPCPSPSRGFAAGPSLSRRTGEGD